MKRILCAVMICAMIVTQISCGSLTEISGKEVPPGRNNGELVTRLFMCNGEHFYLTNAGALCRSNTGEEIFRFPSADVLWSDSMSAFLFTDENKVFTYDLRKMATNIWENAGGLKIEKLLGCTECGVLAETKSGKLYFVSFCSNEQKKLDTESEDVILVAENKMFLQRETDIVVVNTTDWETNVINGCIPNGGLLSVGAIGKSVYALCENDSGYELLACDLESGTSMSLPLPTEVYDARPAAISSDAERLFVAMESSNMVSLFVLQSGDHEEELAWEKVATVSNMFYELPGTFLMCIDEKIYSCAVTTDERVAYGQYNNA